MSRIAITEEMVINTLKEILNNQLSDPEIAQKCLGDRSHHKTVTDLRRNPPGFKKDRKTGELHLAKPRGTRTWQTSSMPNPN